MRFRFIVLASLAVPAAVALALAACSESTDGAIPYSDAAAPAVDAPLNQPAGDGSIPTVDGSMVTASSVLLNEISATDEWVELVASGNVAADLSGYSVADSEKDGGGPKLADSAKLPSGTVLSPKSYLIVQGGGIDAGVGKPCPDGGQSYCFNANFGISNKSGETLYLVDPSGKIVGSAVYPPKAADAGETWGRVPNADPSGSFAITVPTPGAANVAK